MGQNIDVKARCLLRELDGLQEEIEDKIAKHGVRVVLLAVRLAVAGVRGRNERAPAHATDRQGVTSAGAHTGGSGGPPRPHSFLPSGRPLVAAAGLNTPSPD